jgi:predicted DNA-binding transcriptional regulator AlpA
MTQSPALDDKLISERDARYLAGGISAMSWWRWSNRFDDFPSVYKICGRNYYLLADVKAWLARRREAA